MIAPVFAQRTRRRAPITAWLERVVLHGGDGETLIVNARVYPDAAIVVLEEVSSDGSLSVVADVREILLELAQRYPETMQVARIAMVQPRNMWTTRLRYMEWRPAEPISAGWQPIWRQELVRLTRDTSLPTP